MKILIVGGDARGSWQMRGLQMGAALGARVTLRPSDQDWAWADLVVLVKRAALVWSAKTRQLSVPVVWDALDFWIQPEQNQTSRRQLIAEAKQIAEAAGVSLIIGATRQMADDLCGVYLPHHCRIGLKPTPPRAKAEVVGYDGTKKYLGKWLPMLEQVCEAMGLRFVVNPKDLRHVDALVSFRDGRWDGDVCRAWKSGVKHVNALVAGRPMICQYAASWREVGALVSLVESPDKLIDGLQYATRQAAREASYEHGLENASKFTVDAIADQYREILQNVVRRAA